MADPTPSRTVAAVLQGTSTEFTRRGRGEGGDRSGGVRQSESTSEQCSEALGDKALEVTPPRAREQSLVELQFHPHIVAFREAPAEPGAEAVGRSAVGEGRPDQGRR